MNTLKKLHYVSAIEKKMKPSNIKNCKACDADISDLHGNTVRCAPCSKLHRREYIRLLMSKRWPAMKAERLRHYTSDDLLVIDNHHMTDLGTFKLAKFSGDDWEKEYNVIKGLKKYLNLE